MDFSVVALNRCQQAFVDELHTFLDEHLTTGLHARLRETADKFDEGFCRALGDKGWIMPQWPVADGGAALDDVCLHILEAEMERRRAPYNFTDRNKWVWSALNAFGDAGVCRELKPRVARGDVRFALGYTEPEGGSDIAAARTRAVRDGQGWIINGSKMFMTGAHFCQYTFLLTRTDRNKPKHKGLTMFLVPLDSDGVEIQPVQTMGDERTNIVYFSDVKIADRYRIGDVDAGWSVLHGPLDDEHGVDAAGNGLSDPSVGRQYLLNLEKALAAVVAWSKRAPSAGGLPAIESDPFLYTLGQILVQVEAAIVTPSAMGRIIGSEVMISGSQALMDLVGAEATLPFDADGALGAGILEFAHRFAPATAIYGGTTEVFRSIVAEHHLGLPRPDYPGRKVLA